MAERCREWLAKLPPNGPPVLAVTHAGPIRLIRALLAGEPLLTHFATAVPFAKPLVLEVKPMGPALGRDGERNDDPHP